METITRTSKIFAARVLGMSIYGDKVAMPKIGAGLAGGDWNVIEKIIEEECKGVQPVVYYLYWYMGFRIRSTLLE
jgi:O-acetyl-ADP-ribose deacetylase (regulator of RNase III)